MPTSPTPTQIHKKSVLKINRTYWKVCAPHVKKVQKEIRDINRALKQARTANYGVKWDRTGAPPVRAAEEYQKAKNLANETHAIAIAEIQATYQKACAHHEAAHAIAIAEAYRVYEAAQATYLIDQVAARDRAAVAFLQQKIKRQKRFDTLATNHLQSENNILPRPL
jgi:hypothetical protein